LDDEHRDKKRSRWFEIFEEFERVQKLMDDLIKSFEASHGKREKLDPYAYGFSVSFKPDGRLNVRRLKDMEKDQLDSQLCDDWEPLIDVFESNGEVTVVIGTFGAQKEDIGLSMVAGNRLTISVNNHQLNYHKELLLPVKVDPKSARATYKNGVLTINLKPAKRKLFRNLLG